MAAEHKGLEIIDNLFDLGQHVLKEEITILAPYLRDMILKVNRTVDDAEDEDQSSSIRQS